MLGPPCLPVPRGKSKAASICRQPITPCCCRHASLCLPAARMPAQDALFFSALPPELAALYRGGQPAVEAAAQAAAVQQPRQEQQLEQNGGSPLRGAEVAAGAAGSSRKRLWAAADQPVQQDGLEQAQHSAQKEQQPGLEVQQPGQMEQQPGEQEQRPGQKGPPRGEPGEEWDVVCMLSGSEGD